MNWNNLVKQQNIEKQLSVDIFFVSYESTQFQFNRNRLWADFTWNDVHDAVHPNPGKCMVNFWLSYICGSSLDNKKRKDRQQRAEFAKRVFGDGFWRMCQVRGIQI